MAAKLTKVEFSGWENCLKLQDESLEMIITTDVGPRVISLSAPGGKNMMNVDAATAGKTGGGDWHAYGGHRLWHSPEIMPRTYEPDNIPVEWKEVPNGVALINEPFEGRGIQKEIEITLSGGTATLKHRLTNRSLWPVELAVWALTVMAAGGMEVLPLITPAKSQVSLLPSFPLVMWPYTDFADSRLNFGRKYICLSQDPDCEGPTKLGYFNPFGWAAYVNFDQLFIKRFDADDPANIAKYPDFGCSYETFSNESMVEMETLSQMTVLQPGESAEHTERWNVYAGAARPAPGDEAALDALLSQYI